VLGFGAATGGDEVFRALVMARTIEPTSKLDCLRVLEEVGVEPPSFAMLKRRLPLFAQQSFRAGLAAACAAHAGLGSASLVLYDVSTLYFETDTGGWVLSLPRQGDAEGPAILHLLRNTKLNHRATSR
jgi:hypothetical protein